MLMREPVQLKNNKRGKMMKNKTKIRMSLKAVSLIMTRMKFGRNSMMINTKVLF